MNPGVSGTVGQSIFYAAAFHQRVYSNIAQFFATYPTLFQLYGDYDHKIFQTLGITNFASGNGTSGFNNDANWNEFAVSNTFDPAKADPNGIDEAIQCVYGWDATISAGFAPNTYTQPGQVPLSPTRQCALNVTL
jgi:hypothetical protein